VRRIVEGAGVALEDAPTDETAPRQLDLAAADVAKVVRGSEGRASIGLPPFGDERDDKTVAELGEAAKYGSKARGDVAVVAAEGAVDEAVDDDEPGAVAPPQAKVA
jgi:hypothetical protein